MKLFKDIRLDGRRSFRLVDGDEDGDIVVDRPLLVVTANTIAEAQDLESFFDQWVRQKEAARGQEAPA